VAKAFLSLAAIYGFCAVAFGAFGAHALRAQLSPRMIEVFETAVQYHLVHSLALAFVALAAQVWRGEKLLLWVGGCFSVGVFVFSGSLYALALSGITKFGMITPLGGICLLVAWALLFVFALKRQ